MYAALIGLIGAGALGVQDIPLGWKLPLELAVVVAGAFTVWKIENKPSDPPPPAWPAGTTFPAWEEPASTDDEPGALYAIHFPARQEPPQYRLAA